MIVVGGKFFHYIDDEDQEHLVTKPYDPQTQ